MSYDSLVGKPASAHSTTHRPRHELARRVFSAVDRTLAARGATYEWWIDFGVYSPKAFALLERQTQELAAEGDAEIVEGRVDLASGRFQVSGPHYGRVCGEREARYQQLEDGRWLRDLPEDLPFCLPGIWAPEDARLPLEVIKAATTRVFPIDRGRSKAYRVELWPPRVDLLEMRDRSSGGPRWAEVEIAPSGLIDRVVLQKISAEDGQSAAPSIYTLFNFTRFGPVAPIVLPRPANTISRVEWSMERDE